MDYGNLKKGWKLLGRDNRRTRKENSHTSTVAFPTKNAEADA